MHTSKHKFRGLKSAISKYLRSKDLYRYNFLTNYSLIQEPDADILAEAIVQILYRIRRDNKSEDLNKADG